MELDAIQGHVRESKDKCATLIKKMETFSPADAPQSSSPGLSFHVQKQSSKVDQSSSPMFKQNMVNAAQSPGIRIAGESQDNSFATKEQAVTPDSSASFFASNGNESQNAQQLSLNLQTCKGEIGHHHAKRISSMIGIKL